MQKRLFLALELPSDVREAITAISYGVPGAYWAEEDTLHLTLRYLGPVDGRTTEELCERLRLLKAQPFEIQLKGLGVFPPRGEPEVLWLGVERSESLMALRAKVEHLVTRVGIEPDHRKWIPHVTIARLENTVDSRLGHYMGGNGLWKSRPFMVEHLTLFQSHLRDWGSEYEREELFVLRD